MIPTRPRAAKVALLLPLLWLADRPAWGRDIADALAEARTLLARDESRKAAAVLEAVLPGLDAAHRGAVLDELRRAYRLALAEAERSGRAAEAAGYRENLAILDRNPRPKPSTAPPAGPKSVAPAPAPAAPVMSDPPPMLAGPAAQPDEIADPPDSTTGSPPQSDAPLVAESGPASELEAADAAFRARRYDEAGRIYTTLAQKGLLPDERRDAWAYTRMAEVVRRLNAGPRTSQEWSQIQAEVEQIRRLTPHHWYGEYLRNLIAERSGQTRKPASNQVVLRGAEPDGPARGRRRNFVQAASTPRQPAPAPPIPNPQVSPWQILETTNFRIHHANPVLARKAADAAEAARAEQARRWGSAAEGSPWSPPCDIYLYPNATIFHQRTGQPESSPGYSTMGMSAGRITARRINLRADHPNLLATVLPHEVTHVVLADLFPDLQVPRWADEGMAVLSEPVAEQDLRAADLVEPLAQNRLFRLADLVSMDYPDGRYWGLYYAQSVSLTRYLVGLGTPRQFVAFVRAAQRNGFETELKRTYGIDGFDDLQRRWLLHVRGGPAIAAASNAEPAERQ